MRHFRPGLHWFFVPALLLCLGSVTTLSAQTKKGKAKKAKQEETAGAIPTQPTAETRYKVEGGTLKEIKIETPSDTTLQSSTVPSDTTDRMASPDTTVRSTSDLRPDSTVRSDTTVIDLQEMPVEIDSTALLTKRQKRKEEKLADTSTVRYSKLFRDTIPISRVIALSLPLPGFSQVYNKQAWKVPILYGMTGTLAYFGFQQNKHYIRLRDQVESMQAANVDRSAINPVQRDMIVKNTTRSLLFIGAIASYMYFLGDGVMNYQGSTTDVKKATTLSMICPGAGQIYNRSYWKAPIVVGAFATMAYVIDYNARGYNRYRRAYELRTDNDPNTRDEFADYSWVTDEYLKTLKNNFRRNRDLCIIITAGLYILNVIDAHVDAHLKNYDISDDLAFSVEPTLMPYYTRNNMPANGLGLSFKFRF